MGNRENVLARGRRKEKMFTNVFGGIFIFIGVAFLAVILGIMAYQQDFRKNSGKVEAVIVSMNRVGSTMGSPVVEYTVEGKSYRGVLNVTSSDMYEGKHIWIDYRKDDPREITYTAVFSWLLPVFGFIGLVFLTIGLAVVFTAKKNREKVNRLVEAGLYVEAEITDMQEDLNTSMNGKHPIIVSCRYESPEGKLYLYHSRSVWVNSYDIDRKKKVRVYVDYRDPSNYYVDVSSTIS